MDFFDPEWYRHQYPDVDLSGIEPAEHYQRIGKFLGRKAVGEIGRSGVFTESNPVSRTHEPSYSESVGEHPRSEYSIEDRIVTDPASEVAPAEQRAENWNCSTFQGFGTIEHNPLISVIIISHASNSDLIALLPTLSKQSYKNIETIVVETGGANTKELCESQLSNVTYITTENIGFAAANNLACQHAKGELILLLNPDTRLDEKCVQSLLDSIRFDEHAAVCCPKIYFYKEFIRLSITAESDFCINLDEFISQLSYKKYFLRSGDFVGPDVYSSQNCIEIDIPHEPINTKTTLTLRSQDAKAFKIKLGFNSDSVENNDQGHVTTTLNFDAYTFSNANLLINNAGSGIRSDGQPYDCGFAEYDDGRYFSKTYLSAFCGCCALVRRAAILKRKLFVNEFFAYFEDSEMSFWLHQNHMRILYSPNAVVYHKHSESTGDESPLKQLLVRRSSALYEYLTGKNTSKENILSHSSLYSGIPGSISKHLELYDNTILVSEDLRADARWEKPTLCIYNSYFSSMGGGEKHCLDIASIAQHEYEVFLVAENNFCIEELQRYFGIDLSMCRKIVNKRVNRWFTSNFDVFINSTFRSNLVSDARTSYYIVSFPHQHVTNDVLKAYKFLHNSEFTKSWADRYWGDHCNSVLWPVLGFKQAPLSAANGSKEQVFLSVGRFIYGGHCKNHHAIIEAFKNALDNGLIAADWRLVIAGSYNPGDPDAVNYYRDLLAMVDRDNISVIANASRETIEGLYRDARCYVHATGLGVPASEPERHEHFGIAPFEGLLNGCYCLSYHIGGPADLISGNPAVGATFKSIDELSRLMAGYANRDCPASVTSIDGVERATTLRKLAWESARCLLGKQHD